MENKSINEFSEHLGEYINSLNIDTLDKVELLINIIHFLNDYKENTQVLEEHRKLKLIRKEDD